VEAKTVTDGQLSQKEQDAITKTMFQDPDSVRGMLILAMWIVVLIMSLPSTPILTNVLLNPMPTPTLARYAQYTYLHSPTYLLNHHTSFRSRSELVASGITLNGFKFMAVRVDSEQVIGRKGQRGVFIIPTQQAILIAEVSQGHLFQRRCTDQQYDEPIQAAETSVVASKLAEYLTGVGY
jgi:hypothetical protein